MPEKPKSAIPSAPITQGYSAGQFISAFRFILVIIAVGGMFMFWSETRPIPNKIATLRNFEMPDSVQDAHHYHNSYSDQPRISRFTIRFADVDQFLNSFEDDSRELCLLDNLEKSYMPDFTLSSPFYWWNPQDAIEYEGAYCWRRYDSGLEKHQLMLIDYSISGEATIYFEEYTVDNNTRAGFE